MVYRQRGVTYAMFILALATSSTGVISLTSEYVGSFASLTICQDEVKRLEAEDAANVAANPNGKKIDLVRQCMRRS